MSTTNAIAPQYGRKLTQCIAIVGSRWFSYFDRVRHYVRNLPPGDWIVTGDASGVDEVAADEARAMGRRVEVLPADWKQYGLAAGPIRNAELAKRCDRMVAFWDGRSPGTRNAVKQAKKLGKHVTLFEERDEALT